MTEEIAFNAAYKQLQRPKYNALEAESLKNFVIAYEAAKEPDPLLPSIKQYLKALQDFANYGDYPYKIEHDRAEGELLGQIKQAEEKERQRKNPLKGKIAYTTIGELPEMDNKGNPTNRKNNGDLL